MQRVRGQGCEIRKIVVISYLFSYRAARAQTCKTVCAVLALASDDGGSTMADGYLPLPHCKGLRHGLLLSDVLRLAVHLRCRHGEGRPGRLLSVVQCAQLLPVLHRLQRARQGRREVRHQRGRVHVLHLRVLLPRLLRAPNH